MLFTYQSIKKKKEEEITSLKVSRTLVLQSSVLIHNLGHSLLTVMDLSRVGLAGGLFQSFKSDGFLTFFGNKLIRNLKFF